jgi:hypothetical protein
MVSKKQVLMNPMSEIGEGIKKRAGLVMKTMK